MIIKFPFLFAAKCNHYCSTLPAAGQIREAHHCFFWCCWRGGGGCWLLFGVGAFLLFSLIEGGTSWWNLIFHWKKTHQVKTILHTAQSLFYAILCPSLFPPSLGHQILQSTWCFPPCMQRSTEVQYSTFNVSSSPQMNGRSAIYKRATHSTVYFKANVMLLNRNWICFLAI